LQECSGLLIGGKREIKMHKIVNDRKYIKTPDHPFVDQNGYVSESRLMAEKALGKFLSRKHPVHHHPDKKNFSNLVICENIGYHTFIHRRMNALNDLGDVHARKCAFCHRYDLESNLVMNTAGCKRGAYHQICRSLYDKLWKCKNRNKVLSANKKYYENHKEKLLKYQNQYYKNYKEQILQQRRVFSLKTGRLKHGMRDHEDFLD